MDFANPLNYPEAMPFDVEDVEGLFVGDAEDMLPAQTIVVSNMQIGGFRSYSPLKSYKWHPEVDCSFEDENGKTIDDITSVKSRSKVHVKFDGSIATLSNLKKDSIVDIDITRNGEVTKIMLRFE